MPLSIPRRRQFPAAVAVGVLASAAAALVLGQLIDGPASWAVLREVELPILMSAIASLGLSMVVRTARWRTIVPGTQLRPTRIASLLPIVIVGYATNALAPLRAGDAARGVITARRFQLGGPETLGAIGLERVTDALALACLMLIVSMGVVVPGWFTQASVLIALAGAAIIGALIVGGMLGRRMAQSNSIGRRFVRGARSSNGQIARSFGWSLVAWSLDGVTFWLCAAALGLTISPMVAILVAGGAALGSVAPSAPAALGTFELAGTAVAMSLGVNASDAFALVVLAHAVTVIPIVAAAVVVTASAGVSLSTLTGMPSERDDAPRPSVSTGSVT
jgi:uncharacterized membrane protein YbhN (UPF0104 family)